ncbi:cytochrome P450 [Frankia sp. CNm7]|uniref:Cytochrome P450 n=2 Tax=Frankia nepalensis TaxID=1836974 RepID=A0A937RF88_9ACTN|nr:cytochrome P450 [Frankia nepalensis]MBL7511657.1 cytochrome P450 [Frankia nepalensis]MBL7524668.1 cytochrome P450 [Frankia nepalensis]MBL7631101.1 cytochrome P450 [Frankia nepalensis]
MRERQPVYYSERHDFHALTRYDDVSTALKDWETFSSARGVDLESIKKGAVAPAGIIALDPPDQTRLRVLVSRAFTPRAILGLEPMVKEVIDRRLDALGDTFDAVEDFSALFPIEIISRMLGIPPERHAFVRRSVDRMLARRDSLAMSDDQLAVAIELGAYYYTLCVERRDNLGDDMISRLIAAEVERDDGTRLGLTDVEIASFVSLLGNAGSETVTKLVANAFVLFFQNPDQWRLLQENPALIPRAVEEILRFDPPVSYVGRYATRDVTLHGRTIPRGGAVLLAIGAATRDEAAYADPDRFDITRPVRHNLGFGYGVHNCLGAALARIESRLALTEMLRRMPTYRVDLSGLQRVRMANVRGFAHVPVEVVGR